MYVPCFLIILSGVFILFPSNPNFSGSTYSSLPTMVFFPSKKYFLPTTYCGKSIELGFPGGTSDKQPPANAGDARDPGLILGWEDPLEESTQPTPVFLPGESHGQRSLAGHSPWNHKELDTTEVT